MLKDTLAPIWFRLKFLANGNAEWVDQTTGEIDAVKEDWSTRWAIAGIHSNSWRWVRRWGEMKCGCTRNPVTRRMVLHLVGCERHCFIDFLDGEEFD